MKVNTTLGFAIIKATKSKRIFTGVRNLDVKLHTYFGLQNHGGKTLWISMSSSSMLISTA